MPRIPYSLLDLCPIPQGQSPAHAFTNTLDLARHAEQWGYTRYWLAEHHNIPGIASAATSLLIAHVAAHTTRIRVGAGGIMLPNHSPLTIAEQFGTLETLYPNRIDLAVGRAPGGDPQTARALRRENKQDTFPEDVQELQSYFRPPTPSGVAPSATTSDTQTPAPQRSPDAETSSNRKSAFDIRHSQPVRAIPGHDLTIPLYILGSSLFGARLAAHLGLPFAFASHFAPDHLTHALHLYRQHFQPSPQLDHPHAIVAANLFAADTDDEARHLFTTLQQSFLNLIRGHPTQLPPPVQSMTNLWTPAEEAQVTHMTHYSAVGSPKTIKPQLEQILAQTQADELILTGQIYDHAARLHSFELAASIMGSNAINVGKQIVDDSRSLRGP